MSECDLPLYHIQTAGRRNEGTSFLPSGYSVMTLTFSYSKMDERSVYLHEMYGMETAKRCPHCIERVCSEGPWSMSRRTIALGLGDLTWSRKNIKYAGK